MNMNDLLMREAFLSSTVRGECENGILYYGREIAYPEKFLMNFMVLWVAWVSALFLKKGAEHWDALNDLLYLNYKQHSK